MSIEKQLASLISENAALKHQLTSALAALAEAEAKARQSKKHHEFYQGKCSDFMDANIKLAEQLSSALAACKVKDEALTLAQRLVSDLCYGSLELHESATIARRIDLKISTALAIQPDSSAIGSRNETSLGRAEAYCRG